MHAPAGLWIFTRKTRMQAFRKRLNAREPNAAGSASDLHSPVPARAPVVFSLAFPPGWISDALTNESQDGAGVRHDLCLLMARVPGLKTTQEVVS